VPDRELRQRAIASLVLGVLSLVAFYGLRGHLRHFAYPLLFSAVVGVASVVIGITALRKARRTGAYRPRGAIGGIVLGTLAALLSIPTLIFYLIFPRQVDNYFTCLSQAQSASSDRACMDKFSRSIQLSGLGSIGTARMSRAQAESPSSAGPAGHAHGKADGPRGRLAEGAPAPSLAHLSR
jgi:hypothetical protein